MTNWRHLLERALSADEFNDEEQYGSTNQGHIYDRLVHLLQAFLPAEGTALEIGPGSMPITEATLGMGLEWTYVEPSNARREALTEKVGEDPTIVLGYAEDMPVGERLYDAVVMMNGFFQVRSDYEAVLEISRVLKLGGRLLFNIHTSDAVDIVVGRVLGHRNTVRMLKQFGFEPLCVWEGVVNAEHRSGGEERQAFICVEKVRDAFATNINQPQLIPWDENEMPDGVDLYIGRNINLKGRESYLA